MDDRYDVIVFHLLSSGGSMPSLSQLLIRTALIWLAVGYTVGGLLLLN
jgi:hypothetical protein